jgi:outer membrane protein
MREKLGGLPARLAAAGLGFVLGLGSGPGWALAGARTQTEGPAPETVTLSEAIEQVLARNPSLKEAEATVAVFRARVSESRSPLLPQVRGDVSYSRISPLQQITLPEFGTFQLYPANNYDLHATASQMVFDFNRTRESVDLARSLVTSASDRWAIVRRDLEVQTTLLFDSVLFLEQSIDVLDEHVATLEGHLATARKRLAAGTGTELDVLNTRVRIVAARNQRLDLRDAREKQVLALRRLMGRADSAPLRFEGRLAPETVLLDAEAMIGAALARRLEVRAVENTIRTADIQARVAALVNRPSLSVSVMAGFKNGFIPSLNVMKFNYVAAVLADFPLFDGERGLALRAEAAANLKALESRRTDVEAMVRTEVLQALADVRTSGEKLESVGINVVQARKALDYAQARYEAGTITSLDLQDTEDALTQAEFTRLRALYDLVVNQVSLARAVGDPVPKT